MYRFRKIRSCVDFVLSATQMSLPKPEMCKRMGYFVCEMAVTCSIGYGLANNGNKRLIFLHWVNFQNNFQALGNFIENAIFRIFIKISFPVKFKRFSVLLITCIMQVTCKQKSAENVYSRKCYAPQFDFCIFLQNHIA